MKSKIILPTIKPNVNSVNLLLSITNKLILFTSIKNDAVNEI
jgi:hypothetical protein